ncbi:hypothetical protein DFO46_1366 [Rhizobium sp. AG855]|nr:hypothetical protein DFO46_1366 [Rhizobium sp. AG855]
MEIGAVERREVVYNNGRDSAHWYRRIEGLVTALHGGANAVRVDFPLPDQMTLAEAGVTVSAAEERDGVPWSNDLPWSNGLNWHVPYPTVSVAAAADRSGTVVSLASGYWGHRLDIGDVIGFRPLHFGMYMVTQVLSSGTYRIWPPLRKAITTETLATLTPVLAMTLDSEASADLSRGVAHGEETTLILSEVFDYDVRDYFTE